MGLFYSNDSKFLLVDYVDAEYLLDPHKCRSQIGYLFTYGVLPYHGIQQICSSDNLVDLFTKILPTLTFEILLHNIGMRQLKM